MKFKKRTKALLSGLLVICLGGVGCSEGCGYPNVPTYPFHGKYDDEEGVIEEAERQSDELDQYIRDWMDGEVPARIPNRLLPSGRDARLGAYVLKEPSDVDPEDHWAIRPSHEIDRDAAYGLFNDPAATYLLNPAVLVPFGHKIVIEGQFPHARYFSIQGTPSFVPTAYRYDAGGIGDVAWVDADIEPLPGHTNPYRVGAERNAELRSYRVTCDVTIGNPTELDAEAWSLPYFRDPGNNKRHCSGLVFRGPWGSDEFKTPLADKRGLWVDGDIWIRYYLPDRDVGPLGGVPLPSLHYELPDGRKYVIVADKTDVQEAADRTRALESQSPKAPSDQNGPGVGWKKQFDIFRAIYTGIARDANIPNKKSSDQRDYVRRLTRNVTSRGEGRPGVQGLEPHATAGVHINYLLRGMCLERNRLMVLSGKLPTFPETHDGQPIMEGAQARFWSLTGYSQAAELFNSEFVYGAEIMSIFDEQVVLNDDREYVIVLGRSADRPNNATAENGVTWQSWGPEACQAFTIRWVTIGDEWAFEKSPHQSNIGWGADWASDSYDSSIIGQNNRDGFLGEYQPIVSYMHPDDFEELQGDVDPSALPAY